MYDPVQQAQRRARIAEICGHLDHVLPGQGPILDFVHHNTLHGYQHLPFTEALAAAEEMTGIRGYLPDIDFRRFYQKGRITDRDLDAAFAQYPDLAAEVLVCKSQGRAITRKSIYQVALHFDLAAVNTHHLQWQIQTQNALDKLQADVPEAVRQKFALEDSGIKPLWTSLMDKLGLCEAALHPETMMDLCLDQAQSWLTSFLQTASPSMHEHVQAQALLNLDGLFAQLGDNLSMRGLVQVLSGIDLLDEVRPHLVRICASALDEGVAAWHLPERAKLGLYGAWRACVNDDITQFLHQLSEWQSTVEALPDNAVDAIILHLTALEIPEDRWEGYLRRLALELPGWLGMINWRQQHPNYHASEAAAPTLADYLAIRLSLDSLWLKQICHDIWKVEAKLSSLRSYFCKNLSEFLVRQTLYRGILPEYLTQQAEALIIRAGSERQCRADWQALADLIATWQHSPLAAQPGHGVETSAWPLFRLCQHLGLNASQVDKLEQTDLNAMLAVVRGFDANSRGQIWLTAYELHYRDDLFQALRANQAKRKSWVKRYARPAMQIMLCMDEREESFRRHLEELIPGIETLGAAGFFGIPMNYLSLDAQHTFTERNGSGASFAERSRSVPLCPVVLTPAHEVRETAKFGEAQKRQARQRGQGHYQALTALIHQGLRRNTLNAHLAIGLLAPFTLLDMLAQSLMPGWHNAFKKALRRIVMPEVATELQISAETASPSDQHQPAFTDTEQAERVAALLRTVGLSTGFAPFVILAGHGSTSQNNPHEAAHDCGACGGRQGGPNARAFAAMANREEVRRLLETQGIHIPPDCHFIGAQHDTCNDNIIWYDLDNLPPAKAATFAELERSIRHAQALSAHERSRRFATAEAKTPAQAFRHVTLRAQDLSQVRPEFGHATNAAAFIGRRAATQGLFLDRRVFLISYDPSQDPAGNILENILLVAGPVGAGINLEYYFSTVNNDRYGCGTKTPHNVTGLIGVMEGTASDLRTGLPKQMVEIHEAMRLQIIVEAKTSILEAIYARQESLRELIGGGWVFLSTQNPDTGELHTFNPDTGFEPWQQAKRDLPECRDSMECYQGQSEAVPPKLIAQKLF